jgi:class I fructose-bisphosphate aldolase
MNTNQIAELLGNNADNLLKHECKTISKENLHLPGHDFVDRVFAGSNRNPQVLRNLQSIYNTGRLSGTGYVSILPVDQGIEHSAGASFAPNPAFFDPENIVKLAIEGGCNAVASTYGVLASVSRKYAHKIPFIVKINHNEFLSYPNKFDQIMFGSVDEAWNMGAAAVGATIISVLMNQAVRFRKLLLHLSVHMNWVWQQFYGATCATMPSRKDGVDYHTAADITGQANHLGVTIQADIIKQKLPTNNGGYTALNFGKTHKKVYDELTTDHPIDLARYQVANCYMGRQGLINSGGESKGASDLAEAVTTAVINKRAGGQGLISGRKAFQKPVKEGVALLNAIQDVYLNKDITIA